MIDVIYREDVSEDSIHEPRNVKQTGSVDPKYRIYMEDTVLTCIRKISAAENEVYFGLLLGELKRAAGTTYLFIRGMVKAERKNSGEAGEKEDKRTEYGLKNKERMAGSEQILNEKTEVWGTGSGAVALERLTLDRERRLEEDDRRQMPVKECGTAADRKCSTVADRECGTAADRKCSTAKDRECSTAREEENPVEEAADHGVGENPCERPQIVLDGEIWTKLYEAINRYFPDMEILGWYASFPFLNVPEFELCREIHYTHFSGADKVLFLCDRIEREENFYRPDGAELRETEGYFTFFEKNDAMLTYQQENSPQDAKEGEQKTEGEPRGIFRQGTVGEAPRRKWNISAASVLLTAALLAAVLLVNQYNSRLRAESTGSAGEAVEEGTTSVQSLAVDGQVMDSPSEGTQTGDGSTDGEKAENWNANSEGAGSEGKDVEGAGDADANSEGTGDGNADGDGSSNGNTDSEGTGDGNADGEGTGKGNTDSEGAGDGNADGEGTGDGGTNSEGAENGNADDSENGDEQSAGAGADSLGGAGNSSNENDGSEAETVQTGSRVSARYYTVKNGETLYSICMDVYKTSAMVEIVRMLNGIGEDYVIQEGQKILLP